MNLVYKEDVRDLFDVLDVPIIGCDLTNYHDGQTTSTPTLQHPNNTF